MKLITPFLSATSLVHSSLCVDSIANLNLPLRALLSVFVGAKIDVHALLGAQVNLSLLVSLGISLNIGASVKVGV